jgi:hypothetical protein
MIMLFPNNRNLDNVDLAQLLHMGMVSLHWFGVCVQPSDPFEPCLCLLLWGSSFDDTTVVHDASGGVEAVFAGFRLSDVQRILILSIIRVLP